MKCVVDRHDLQTYRTTDKEASRKIASGRYELTSKRTWKAQGRRR